MLALALLSSFALTDAAGNLHTHAELTGKKAVVMVFTTTDCPVTNSYIPELNRLAAEYAPRGAAFYAVHSDPTQTPEQVRAFSRDFALSFPVLLDPELRLARELGAKTMPEAAVLDSSGKLLYLGRVDDRVIDFGRKRAAATTHELRDALDAAIEGWPAPVPASPPWPRAPSLCG